MAKSESAAIAPKADSLVDGPKSKSFTIPARGEANPVMLPPMDTLVDEAPIQVMPPQGPEVKDPVPAQPADQGKKQIDTSKLAPNRHFPARRLP